MNIHRLNFGLNELIKLAFVDIAKTVEAETADDLFLKPFVQVRAFFGSDQHIYFFDAA
jgi:hypothetical protein